MTGAMLGQIAGGIGIFLLAISMLTQGLQMVSGNVLRQLLAQWTRTPLRGIGLGIITTAVLQSSSVMTAALIGLVNASLLSLGQAIWVVLGTNIGTTFTGWMVSVTGLDVNIKAYALPMVGVGMALKIFGQRVEYVAVGMALAGLGLFFVGVDILKDAFSVYSAEAESLDVGYGGVLGLLMLVAAGVVMTIATQSSSASLALILTATAGGVITLESGAYLLIGANLGTTSTAVLAVIGATANAKRTAAAHVLFNLVTAVAAMATLKLLLWGIALFAVWQELLLTPMVTLAVLHTGFKVLGVLVMSPFVPWMTRFLERRFVSQAEEVGRPRYLDHNSLHMPVLAVGALIHELGHLHRLVGDMVRRAMQPAITREEERKLRSLREGMESLTSRINEFSAELAQQNVPEDIAQTLPSVLRVNRYLRESTQLAQHATSLRRALQGKSSAAIFYRPCEKFLQSVNGILADNASGANVHGHVLTRLNNQYERAKESLLQAAAKHELPLSEVSALLDDLTHLRRMATQMVKAERYLASLEKLQLVE